LGTSLLQHHFLCSIDVVPSPRLAQVQRHRADRSSRLAVNTRLWWSGIIAGSHALAGRTEEARRAMHHLPRKLGNSLNAFSGGVKVPGKQMGHCHSGCRIDSALHISTLKDWVLLHRPVDLARSRMA
jgi:hypothetical protein